MTTDLGLVAHTPEGDPHETSPHGASDRLTETGLADAGRADERDDRALAPHGPLGRLPTGPIGHTGPTGLTVTGHAGRAVEAAFAAQLADGEVLDDALLDVLEAMVIGVEHDA